MFFGKRVQVIELVYSVESASHSGVIDTAGSALDIYPDVRMSLNGKQGKGARMRQIEAHLRVGDFQCRFAVRSVVEANLSWHFMNVEGQKTTQRGSIDNELRGQSSRSEAGGLGLLFLGQ